MAKRAINIFPGLASKMAYKYHDNHVIAEILGISYDSVLRRLCGHTQFELIEIKKLMMAYDSTFDDLFGNVDSGQKGA